MAGKFLFAVAALLCVAQVAGAGLINGIERRNPDSSSADTEPRITGPLVEDARAFVDRSHHYNQVPAYLIGADYVMVANDDKYNPLYELDIELSGSADLFIFLDNRMGYHYDAGWPGLTPDLVAAGMLWVPWMGFVDTGDDIGIDENGDGSIDNWSSVFVLGGVSGTVTLFQQNDPVYLWRNMYGVAVTPEPATLALLGLGGLFLRRRK